MRIHFLLPFLLVTMWGNPVEARWVNQTQRLYDAILKNDTFTALNAIDQGANVFSIVNGPGTSLLMEAAQKGNFDIFMKLIQKGVNVEYSGGGKSIMIYAMRGGNTRIISYIFDKNADDLNLHMELSECNDVRGNYFHYTICANKFELAKEVLRRRPGALYSGTRYYANPYDNSGETLAYHAYRYVDIDACSYKGCNSKPNKKQWYGLFVDKGFFPQDYLHSILGMDKSFIPKYLKLASNPQYNSFIINLIARAGDYELFKTALAKGFNVNNVHGSSVLMDAVVGGNEKIIKLVLDSNVNLGFAAYNGETALHKAVESGKINFVRMLLDKKHPLPPGLILVAARGRENLSTSQQKAYGEIIKLLAERGADLFYRNQHRENALLAALVYKNIEIVKYLLNLPLGKSVETDLHMVLDRLFQNLKGKSAKAILQELVTRKISLVTKPDRPGNARRTILHFAVEKDDIESLEYLIKNKVERTDVVDYLGQTALLTAVRRLLPDQCTSEICREPCDEEEYYDKAARARCLREETGRRVKIKKSVQALIAEGNSLKIVDPAGNSPLILAIRAQEYEIADKIAQKLDEAGVNHANRRKETALMLAAASGQESLVRKLIARGAMIKKKDAQGNTAVAYAAKSGKDSIVRLLESAVTKRDTVFTWIDGDQPVDRVKKELAKVGTDYNDAGLTHLQVAISKQKKELVRAMMDAGMGVRLSDQSGRSVAKSLVEKNLIEFLPLVINGTDDVLLDVDHNGKNLLTVIIENENEEALQVIFKQAPEALFSERFEANPLQMAVLLRKPKVIDALSRLGVSTMVFNSAGEDLLGQLVKDVGNKEITSKFKAFEDLDAKIHQAAGAKNLAVLKTLAGQKNLNQYVSRTDRFSHVLVRTCAEDFIALLKDQADPKRTRNQEGKSLLFLAAEQCPLEYVQKLDAALGDRPDESAALVFALDENSSKPMVDFVFGKNGAVGKAVFMGQPAIHHLTGTCSVPVLEKLTSEEWFNLRNAKGQLPIVMAIEGCKDDFILAVLKRYRTVFALDAEENNFAHLIIRAKKDESFPLFTEEMLRGVNKHKKSPLLTALEHLDSVAQGELFDLKYKNRVAQKGIDEVQYALQEKKTSLLEDLFKVGVSVDLELDADGTSLLMLAARGGDSALVKLLIGLGAELDKEDRAFGDTALILAVRSRVEESIRALLAAGAKKEKPNKNGETAETLAKAMGMDLNAISNLEPQAPEVETDKKGGSETNEGGKWPAEAEEEIME